MSADRLRAAADLLRSRAEAATAATGEWSVSFIPEQAVPDAHIIDRWFIMDRFESGQETGPYATCEYEPAADYIAMMSPPVALALAEWLDATTTYLQPGLSIEDDLCLKHALELADAIFGPSA